MVVENLQNLFIFKILKSKYKNKKFYYICFGTIGLLKIFKTISLLICKIKIWLFTILFFLWKFPKTVHS